ncbi:hypothetical protein [Myceligenerans crystallogenes]|uniref:ANTAR domain-containing protein n=1 Tax=Myceligenerans crystallogenes TaxID=316335 RepID=A0ABN2NL80_9MICO
MTPQSEEIQPTDAPGAPTAASRARLIARWDAIETAFAAEYYSGESQLLTTAVPRIRKAVEGVFVIHGSRRPDVVVTAVHGTNHVRDGKEKWADRGTGSLAILLSEITGCTALVTLGADGDGNHDFTHPAKTVLLDLPGVRTLVDLHGSAHLPDSPDIEIGTATGYVPDEFIGSVTANQTLRVLVDVARTARNARRITMLAQTHGIRAVQLEIDALRRPPVGNPAPRAELLDALTAALVATPVPTPADTTAEGKR